MQLPLRFLITAALLLALPGASAASSWVVDTVDPTLTSAEGLALRLDGTGRPFLSFGVLPGPILLGMWNGTSWDLENVAPPITPDAEGAQAHLLLHNWETDVAVGPDGEPRIAHVLLNGTGPYPQGTVQVSRRNLGQWTTEPVGSTGGPPSIEMDGANRAHLAYTPNFASVEYAKETAGGWVREPVAAWGRGAVVRLDHAGVPHIAYQGYEPHAVRYATRDDNGDWISTIVAPGGSNAGPSLAFRPDRTPAIAFVDDSTSTLKLAEFDEGDWAVTQVATGSFAFRPSLAYDMAGPHIAFRDNAAGTLVVGDRIGEAWTFETVDPAGGTGIAPSMASDAGGRAWIAFLAIDSPRARYARRTPLVEAPDLDPPPAFGLRLVGTNPVAAGQDPAFRLELPRAADVTLSIWNVAGRQVAQRDLGRLDAGVHALHWGVAAPIPGLYFVRVNAGNGLEAKARVVVTRSAR